MVSWLTCVGTLNLMICDNDFWQRFNMRRVHCHLFHLRVFSVCLNISMLHMLANECFQLGSDHRFSKPVGLA